MKKLILLFSLLLTLSVAGQDFVSGTRYLYGKTSFSNYTIATLTITGTKGDTTVIDYGGQEYSYVDEKLFLDDTVLFFDFGSKEGDTLAYMDGFIEVNIRVDSIRDISLLNGITYPHYFIRDVESRNNYTIIKGIGEKAFGLGIFYWLTIPEFEGVKSVCRNDSLIFWLGGGDTTCNYDSFLDLIGVDEQGKIPYTIYPNPVGTTLVVENLPLGATSTVYGLHGQVYTTNMVGNKMDVSALPQGLYILQVELNNTVYRTKFIKE